MRVVVRLLLCVCLLSVVFCVMRSVCVLCVLLHSACVCLYVRVLCSLLYLFVKNLPPPYQNPCQGCSALFLTSSLVARTIRLDKDEVYATVSLNDKADRNTGSNLDDSEIASSGDEGKRAMMSLDEVKNGTMNAISTDDES